MLCPRFIRALLRTFDTSSRSIIRRGEDEIRREMERETDVGDSDRKSEWTDHEIMDAAAFMSIVQSLSASLLHRETLQTFTNGNPGNSGSHRSRRWAEQRQIDVHDSEQWTSVTTSVTTLPCQVTQLMDYSVTSTVSVKHIDVPVSLSTSKRLKSSHRLLSNTYLPCHHLPLTMHRSVLFSSLPTSAVSYQLTVILRMRSISVSSWCKVYVPYRGASVKY